MPDILGKTKRDAMIDEIALKYANEAMSYPEQSDTPITTDPAWVHGCFQQALDEMALRVFEDTRERAAKIAADAIAPNRRDIADAIRAMQPEAGNGK